MLFNSPPGQWFLSMKEAGEQTFFHMMGGAVQILVCMGALHLQADITLRFHYSCDAVEYLGIVACYSLPVPW